MLLFRTPDLAMLCTLLSNSADWKHLLLNGIESVPSVEKDASILSFILAFHSSNDNKMVFRIL